MTAAEPAGNGVILDPGGWCMPSQSILDLLSIEIPELPELPEMYAVRGGIDFNAPRPPPVYDATHCEHRWERESRALQCDCPQCTPPDPRGLDCTDCSARLNPDDPEFDALYETAPWWWDVEDEEGEAGV